jgi:hypothetical protein
MALNTIPTHPLQDSYVTVTEADSYLEIKSDITIWSSLSTSDKEKYLKLAVRQMEGYRYFGEKAIHDEMYYRAEQNLAFPREDKYQTAQVLSVNSLTFTTNYNQNSSSEFANKYLTVLVYEGTGRGNTFALTSFINGVGTVTSWGGITLDTTSQLILLEADIIPDNVKYAQIEQAYFLSIQKDNTIDLSGSYDKDMIQYDLQAGLPFSNIAKQYLKGYISKIGVLRY